MKIKTLLSPTLFLLLILSTFYCCQNQKEVYSTNGIWIQEGYGRIIHIQDSIYTYYNTTENLCLPLISDGVLTDRFHIIDLNKNKLILNPGGIVNYHFKRIEKLPKNCKTKDQKLDHSPENNFTILWNTFENHYAFFEQREVNWDAIKQQSKQRLKDIKTDEQLYSFFNEIIEPFNDGHIKLDVPEALKDLELNEDHNDKKISKSDVLNDISNTYLNNVYAYNDGTIRWGTIKNKDIGYIAITDMNNFSNYVTNSNLSSDKFWDAYEKKLETKSGIEQLNDEIEGVEFVMHKILNDLSETKSLIIDLRFNGGGYETVALKILSYFIDKPKHILSVKAKNEDRYTDEQKYVLNPDDKTYKGKVVVLTSHNTASAAEIFALGTMAYPDISRFGAPTNGIFSETLWKKLPNGWGFSLSNEVYSDPKGHVFEITGVPANFDIDYPKKRVDFYDSFYKENEFKDIGIERILTQE